MQSPVSCGFRALCGNMRRLCTGAHLALDAERRGRFPDAQRSSSPATTWVSMSTSSQQFIGSMHYSFLSIPLCPVIRTSPYTTCATQLLHECTQTSNCIRFKDNGQRILVGPPIPWYPRWDGHEAAGNVHRHTCCFAPPLMEMSLNCICWHIHHPAHHLTFFFTAFAITY